MCIFAVYCFIDATTKNIALEIKREKRSKHWSRKIHSTSSHKVRPCMKSIFASIKSHSWVHEMISFNHCVFIMQSDATTFRYGISRAEAQTLIYQDHEYMLKLGLGRTNLDKSIPWRCVNYRNSLIKCSGTVCQLVDGVIKIKANHVANCPLLTREDELIAQMKRNWKKRAREEATSCLQIFREETDKVIQLSGDIEAIAPKLKVNIQYYFL